MMVKNKFRQSILTFALIAILLLVFLILPLLFSLMSNGHFQEGLSGFVYVLFIRLIWSIIIVLILVYLFKSKKRYKILWSVLFILAFLIIVLILKNSILDIPYLSSPKKVLIDNIKWETDASYGNSIFYELEGKDNKNKSYIFKVNQSTLKQGEKRLKDYTKILVFYLSHTKVVMDLKYHK